MSSAEESSTVLLDIKTLSKYLSIKISTLYAWASQSKIPCVRIHGLVRFRKEKIDAWLEGLSNEKPETGKIRFRHNSQDIDTLIARVKQEVYNKHRRETRPESAHGKEDKNGAV
jgi:excisionase family DNA binding protein